MRPQRVDAAVLKRLEELLQARERTRMLYQKQRQLPQQPRRPNFVSRSDVTADDFGEELAQIDTQRNTGKALIVASTADPTRACGQAVDPR